MSGKACDPPCAKCLADGRRSLDARAAYHSTAARFERLTGGRRLSLRRALVTVAILVGVVLFAIYGGRLGFRGR